MALIRDYFDKTKNHMNEYGKKTIVLMQVGAFFEVYGLKDKNDNINGSNIMDFSRICDLNVVDKKVCCGSDGVVMAGFKDHLLDKYIKKLQEAGYTVPVYEQDEACPNTSRSLTGVYSPGTYFSTDTENITNNTCCIWIESKNIKRKSLVTVYVGVSIVDIFTGKTSIMEYSEQYIKNPTTFDELERFISIYKPSETILISNLPNSEMEDIVSYANIRSKSLHMICNGDEEEDEDGEGPNEKSKNEPKNDKKDAIKQRIANCEKQTYQMELLNKFYKINDIQSFMGLFNENVYACQSFCYLLDFIYQHNPNLIYNISQPTFENTGKRLILANHSLKQLNIIDDDNYSGKYSSVVKMLNECITPMGKRRFAYDFLNPVTDEEYLQTEYDVTEKMLLLNGMSDIGFLSLRNILQHIKDIPKIMRQIILKKISPKYIYQLYSSLCSAKILLTNSQSNSDLVEYLGKKVDFDALDNQITLIVDYLERVLILEECKEIDNVKKIEKSFVRSGVNKVLDDKIKTLMESEDKLEACRLYFSNLLSKYESSKSSKKDKDSVLDEEKTFVKINETEKNNFRLVATDRRCKILEEAIKGLNKDSTATNKTITLKYTSSYSGTEQSFTLSTHLEFQKQTATNRIITNEEINELCRNVGSIKLHLIDIVSSVYQVIITNMQQYNDELKNISEFITYVDVVYSKAFIADKYNYCKPVIEKNETNNKSIVKSFVQAEGLRHCLIEKIQQSELYVANDIGLGQGTTQGLSQNQSLDGILLYGTNAVGKTSFIKSLGISVIMAQAGLYVPASSYRYKPYKYIFTRILGNDNLFKGLSTFAVEMSELRTILRLSDKNSLVLGDELCSGTESISAVSIFVASIQALTQKQCSFIFATHLHEIIPYEEITSLETVGFKHMSVVYDKEKDCLIYNRKLQDGPGNNMYGLEVCKSLNLPQDFLDNAHNIRMKYNPESGSILQQKGSQYNKKHITGGICEKCKINGAIDVHHLFFQNEADDKGTIRKKELGLSFNKNARANLLNLCQKCHDEIHKTNKKYKKTKTTGGLIVEEV